MVLSKVDVTRLQITKGFCLGFAGYVHKIVDFAFKIPELREKAQPKGRDRYLAGVPKRVDNVMAFLFL